MPETRDVVILGSGPAGLTAAIYAARANLRPLVIEGEPSSTSDQPGGQLMLTTEVENYPGFVDGILGPQLMERFRAQAERFGAEFLTLKATRVTLGDYPFAIWTTDTSAEPEALARGLIVATGARSLMLGVPGEDHLIGHGLSTCATSVTGSLPRTGYSAWWVAETAIEEALFLTRASHAPSRSSTGEKSCAGQRSCKSVPLPTGRSSFSGTRW